MTEKRVLRVLGFSCVAPDEATYTSKITERATIGGGKKHV